MSSFSPPAYLSAFLPLALVALVETSPPDAPLRKIGEMELTLLGVSATVDPINPVVPKNVASGLRIVVRGGEGELSLADVTRFLGEGLEVFAELSGPGLREAVTIPQRSPGDPPPADPLLLPLPPLPVAGDYTIANIRITVSGESVLDVVPNKVTLQVIDQILVTSVKTRPLTLDELKARGVVLDSDDYLGFEFTLGLLLESKPVNITFPVVFDRQGVAVPQPLEPPRDPQRGGVSVNLPLPTIVPLMLEMEEGGGGPPMIKLPDGTEEEVRIPSVLVIPGNVGFLKQFFSAQLFVANGAPGGSGLVVRDVEGTVILPPGADQVPDTADDPLALPETVAGIQPETLPILGLGPDGEPGSGDEVDSFQPGEQGQAEFLIRGEKEGFHTLDFDIEAILEGLPTGPVRVAGKASGGVLVRNPFFDVTFTVPSVVREEEEFSFFVTVHNIGQSLANDVRVTLDASRMSGVELLGDGALSIDTLLAGDAQTVEFRFKSQRNGQVVASYLELDPDGPSTGNLKFTLGVGERGVPLSPDTLVLPTAVDLLPPHIIKAAMRVLGQAWSIANAPAGTLPSDVIRTNTRVVTEKALALAEAGLRVNLGQDLTLAVRDLAFDFYGGSPLDKGFDQLLRETQAGRNFALALGTELAAPMESAGGVLPYEREASRVAASGPDFITFAVGSGSLGAPVDVTLVDAAGRLTESVRAGPDLPVSGVPGAVGISLGPPETAPLLGILTAPISSPYTLELAGTGEGTTELVVTLPRGDGSFLRAATDLSVAAGSRARLVIDLFRPDSLELEEDFEGDGVFESTRALSGEIFSSEGPRLLSATVIGPEILDGASSFGFHTALLFDRVVDATSSAQTHRYEIPDNVLKGAKRQLSGRLVFGSLAQPEGPYLPTTVSVHGIADSRGVTGPDLTVPLASRLTDPGAVVSGRVLNADGTPVNDGTVAYSNFRADRQCTSPTELVFAEVPLADDGRYEFRYVRQDHCGGPFRILNQDSLSGALRSVSGFVRAAGEHITLDIARFGQGTVTGIVRENGAPVPGANVVVVSGTDPQSGGVTTTDGEGRYTVPSILVGPVSVKAAKGTSLGMSSGRIERAGTTATVDVNLDGGTVRASGTVKKLEGGVTTPIPGIQVVYSLKVPGRLAPLAVGVTRTGADGRYVLEALPPGEYKLEAILTLQDTGTVQGVSAAGDDIVADIVIEIPPESSFGRVKGTVFLPGGTPAEDVIVSIGGRGVLTLEDGSFDIPGVAVRPNISQVVLARSRDGLRSGSSAVVVNAPGQLVENVSITLSGLGSAQFTVLDAQGMPVVGQEVRLLGNCGDPCGCVAKNSGPGGVVVFENLSLGRVTARAVLFGNGFVDVASGSASVERDGETGFGTLQFHGVGRVKGVVELPNGSPALGADVTLRSHVFNAAECTLKSGNSHKARTSETGEFSFANVNLGSVGVSARHPFFDTTVGANGTLAVPGEELVLNLRLVDTVSGELSGTVFLPDGVTPAGAAIEVTAEGALPEVIVSTDDSGTYRFAKIFPQGSYTLTARDPVTGGVAREKVFLQAGEDAVHDLRLKGRGTVRVRVVDGADQPVERAFVRLRETDFPGQIHEGAIEAANQGVVTLTNVFEGPFSVEAADVFARGGRTSSVLPGPGQTIDVKVRLTTTGTIEGHFRMPDDAPIPFGVVKLIAGGRVIGQTTTLGSGDVGFFSFDYVPAGALRLEAQDPLTARIGVAVGTLETQDQLLTLDIVAQGLGTVHGLVTSNGLPQPGAHVDIVSGTFRAGTMTDSEGTYLVEGIPEGRIAVTASLANGFLKGTAEKTLSGDGTVLTIDVALRESGEVTGTVTSADGVSPAPPSLVTIQVGGAGGGSQSTTTDTNGAFQFGRVPAGLATLSVDVLGSIDRAKATIEVPAAQTIDVPITLNGVGSITGTALDSNGMPTAGIVTLKGTGEFPYSFTLTLGNDGAFHLPEVLAGPFTASLRAGQGDFTLYGTASGMVVPGEDTSFEIQLQDSGTVTGVVLRADPERTPALGANVALKLDGGRGVVTLQAQSDGRFTALGVPLGEFSLSVSDPLTAGVARVKDLRLDVNGETLDVGEIVLDDSPISVVAFDPVDGAVGIPIDHPIRVTFSDPVQSFAGAITVKNGTSTVPMSAGLSPDALTVILTGALPDSKELTIHVSTAIVDIFGRRPLQAVSSRFRTVDLSPPKVVASVPPNGAIQVDVAAVITITFDEPLAAATDLSSLIALEGPTGAVPGTTTLTSPTTVTFTPESPLAINAVYSMTVNGAVDESGNVQTVPFVASFVTPDTISPVLGLETPLPGSWVSAARPLIRVPLTDGLSGIDPGTATLKLDDVLVTPDSVTTSLLSFTPPADLAEGEHIIIASVADRAGNLGSFSAGFKVDTVAPSAAEITGATPGQILQGTLTLGGTATDAASGVDRIELLRNGFHFLTVTAPTFEKIFNTNNLPEGPLTLSARAVDRAGNVGPEGTPVPVVVDNRAFTVSITSPAEGKRFRDAVLVKATVSEPAERLEFSLGAETLVDASAPYEATFDLAPVAEGTATIVVTGFASSGETTVASRNIVVDRTPPPPPDPSLINAEPPVDGFSLVFGRAGAVEAKAVVDAINTANAATAGTTADSAGSFALSIAASVDDVLSLTATDEVGNTSAPTTIVVRRTPSIPPSEGATTLRFEGVLVDRVGPGAAELSPDGLLDAVFTMSLAIGEGITRELSFIDLEGPVTRSTRPAVGSVLGVATDAGADLLNDPDGSVGFPITTGTTLTLFAADEGFIQEGATYTVTAAFTDGSRFVGTFTIVPAADQNQVAHSVEIQASPATVQGTAGDPGTAVLTLSDIRDIEGTLVPDGAKIALAVSDMASTDPRGGPIRSAGGSILDGEPAANHAEFRVFTISGGEVLATYSTGAVSPSSVRGALTVVQVLAADAEGNVLGTETIATLDLNVRAPTDRAIVHAMPSALYADTTDRRSQVTVEVRDALGNPVPDGTKVLLSAAFCASRVSGNCVNSAGGTIVGGEDSPTSTSYRAFTVLGGVVQAEYSAVGKSTGVGNVSIATVQVVPADENGNRTSTAALGTATIALAGPSSTEMQLSQESVPFVFPERPVQVRVHHVHDGRGHLVPDGAKFLVSATFCATRVSGACVSSAGGTITDGEPSPTAAHLKAFPLSFGELVATYSTEGVSAAPGQVKTAGIQLAMADAAGNRLSTEVVAFKNLKVVAPTHAVGSAEPPTLLANGGLHTTTVTFDPVLDAFGNPLPEGVKVLASAAFCAGRVNGGCVGSAGGQLLNGEATSPTASHLKVFRVENGAVSILYGDQDLTASPGQLKEAKVVLLEAGPNDERLSTEVFGVAPIGLAGLTSAALTASPASLPADGGDRRSTVTLSDFRDAAGVAVPDGTVIAISANFCATRINGGCVSSAGGKILGGTTSPTLASHYRLFPIVNGQVVVEYSAEGISVSSGEKTAVVQVLSVTPDGAAVSSESVATLPIPLLAPASATVAASPMDLLADGGEHLSQITVSDLFDTGRVPLPDGAKVGLTAADCAAVDLDGLCIVSAGGEILTAGTTSGDGDPAANDPSYRIFTVAGGEVRAAYSAAGLTAGVNETRDVRVAVVPADETGALLSTTAYGWGTLHLHGITSATASGPTSLPLSGGEASVTFSGIKDSAGNTVPDGTTVVATAHDCGTLDQNSSCNLSTGGTLTDGAPSPSGAGLKVFTVTGGSVTVTYSTQGAAPGTARVQLAPATPDGAILGNQSLVGGVWEITVEP